MHNYVSTSAENGPAMAGPVPTPIYVPPFSIFFGIFFLGWRGLQRGYIFLIVSDQWLEYSLLKKLETQDIPALQVLIPVRISSSLTSQTSADCFQHHTQGMKGVVTPGRFLCAMSRFLCSSDWLWSHDFELISLCEIGRL